MKSVAVPVAVTEGETVVTSTDKTAVYPKSKLELIPVGVFRPRNKSITEYYRYLNAEMEKKQTSVQAMLV